MQRSSNRTSDFYFFALGVQSDERQREREEQNKYLNEIHREEKFRLDAVSQRILENSNSIIAQ